MSTATTWGGARPGSGAKKHHDIEAKLIKVRFTKAEWAQFQAHTPGDTRERAELMLNLARPSGGVVIVTRHTGAVEWLQRQGIEGEVVVHATPENVIGKTVIGNIPNHLQALAASVKTIEMGDLPPEKRGADLTPDEMDSFGARLAEYVVIRR